MKKDLLWRSYCKSALEPVILTAIALSLTLGNSAIFLVSQTQNQKAEVLARVVPDVDAIKKI